jgi:BirA family biotin operon repressor/biotin-[acetyl-CoA-carboxylase] ligase
LAVAGEPEGTVVVSDEQTAGRGRVGKSRWVTPANTSIAISVLLRPELAPEQLGVLAMIAGLAAVEAVWRGAAVRAGLKWPNDVLVGERKLGGVLVESALSGGAIDYAVAGIGLNGNLRAVELGAFPDAAAPPTTLLEAAGRPVEREAVIAALLEALDERYAAVCAGAIADIRRAFRSVLLTLGQPVRVSGAGWMIEGVAEDVTETGALIVRAADGARRELAFGEVTLRQAQQW